MGAKSGPSSFCKVVHKYLTVSRIHDGTTEILLFGVVNGLVAPALLGVRNLDKETSLVGVPLDGNGRAEEEASALDLGVPAPLGLDTGMTLSRCVKSRL